MANNKKIVLRKTILLMTMITVLFGCSQKGNVSNMSNNQDHVDASLATSAPKNKDDLINPEIFVKGSQTYALNMFKKFNEQTEKDNLIFSPMSIEFMMGILANSSDEKTSQSILSAWQLNEFSFDQVNQNLSQTMSQQKDWAKEGKGAFIANGVFVNKNYTLKTEFREQMSNLYDAEIENIDVHSVRSAKKINKWVSKHTQKRISSILSEEKKYLPLADTILVNAIYFKGEWPEKFFDKNQTTDRLFNGVTKQIALPTMYQHGLKQYYEDQELQSIYLPYKNGHYALIVLLPKNESKDGLSQLVGKLDGSYFSKILKQTMQPEIDYRGELYLPRFNAAYMNDQLLEQSQSILGVDLKSAQFKKIINSPQEMKISNMTHIANITVDEKGTEAAAVTASMMGVTSINMDEKRPTPFVMDVNRPFAYAIMDKDGQIIFLGTTRNIAK